MANSTFKPAAITRAGFEFQDLVGIETLISFYREPDLFDWVTLEADEEDFNSLDDVVAARSDGTYDLVQVKFTVSPDAYPLDWEWLMASRPRGTSLLAKWSGAVERVGAMGPVHSACLRTNRSPSAGFAQAMEGGFINLERLEPDAKVELECGGPDRARDFFRRFEFQTIPESLAGLEARVRLELVPSDMLLSGWYNFREQVRRWAMHRNEPPRGRILHEHLAQVITRKRPEPIRQDFTVPPGYALPSSHFHETFRARIADAAHPVTVLWGTPGRGKSTYLSYLADELRRENRAVIRHHYFLSGDDTADRVSYAEISHSLLAQLVSRHPEAVPVDLEEDTNKLNTTLASAARHLKESGERLYIIVDGLDHVWRDYRKVDQLNFLFNQLLPLPDNVSLVVGTQRVPESQLPNRLLAHSSAEDWIGIPAMDAIAVHSWVTVQDEAGRLLLHGDRSPDDRKEAVGEIAAAFFTVSQGHPLHLIYAFESMTRPGAPIDKDDVLRIPPCPEGDIRTYYASLWNTLGDTGRDILHALAGSEFHWPGLGIRQCLGSFDEIAFLLDPRASGIHPFHGSIFAYVRERPDHAQAFAALLPGIVNWLEGTAAPYWQWGWLWLSKAKGGDFKPLMEGVSRQWAVSSLAAGWPEKQVIRILRTAEEHAFAELDFPRAVELRSIKTRVMNAREFQTQDFAAFEEAAIVASENWQQLSNLLDELPSLTDGEVAMLPRAARADMRDEVTGECVAELGRRIDAWLELRHRPEGEFVTLARRYLDVVALSRSPDMRHTWDFLQGFRKPAGHVRYFGERLAKARNYEALIALRELQSDKAWAEERKRLEDLILKVACVLGANPTARLQVDRKSLSPLFASWFHLQRPTEVVSTVLPPVPSEIGRERNGPGMDLGLSDFVHTLFFATLAAGDPAKTGVQFRYPGLSTGDLGWLGQAMDVVQGVASQVASGGIPADLAAPFVGTAKLSQVPRRRPRATESDEAVYRSVVAALRRIATDLHAIGAVDVFGTSVGLDVLRQARSSPHWNDEIWLEDVAEGGQAVMTPDAVSELLGATGDALAGTISEFNQRADAWTLRSRVAGLHRDRRSLPFAERAADCLLGYGYRKDPWIFDVMDSISIVHDVGLTPSIGWIRSLVPVVERITDFTDGAGTNHAPSEMVDLVAATYPDRLEPLFLHYVEEEEWRLADDCLKAIAKVGLLQSPEMEALLGTYLDPRVLSGLDERAAEGDEVAALIRDRQITFLGGRPTDHSERAYSSEPESDDDQAPMPERGYGDFKGLVEDSQGTGWYRRRKDHFSRWLRRHADEGNGKKALDSIRGYFLGGDPAYSGEEALDAAFSISMETEGRDAAYEWLVRAQVARHGWQSNWTSREEVLARLALAATHYPDRWQRFILDTATPPDFYKKLGYGLTIGSKYLVHFLILVGQRDLAAMTVDAMVKTVLDEVGDLDIADATWFS